MLERIAYHESQFFKVGTVRVPGFKWHYETGVSHVAYNYGEWITVGQYRTIEEARAGHERWVGILSSEDLPDYLEIASTSLLARYLDYSRGREWRRHRRLDTLVVTARP